MRFSIFLTSVSLCGCFVAESKASELKNPRIVANVTLPSIPVDDTSTGLDKARSSHHETENGKFAVDTSDEEARVFLSRKLLKELFGNVEHFYGRHVSVQKIILPELSSEGGEHLSQIRYEHRPRRSEYASQILPKDLPTSEKHMKQPDEASILVSATESFRQKKRHSKEDIQNLFALIERHQDHNDDKIQETAADCLVDMLRRGTIKGVHRAPYQIGRGRAEESTGKWFDEELVQEWVAFYSKWLYTEVLTRKQVQLYESIMTRLSEKEIIDLAFAVRKYENGYDVIRGLVLLLVNDPVTRERGFRLWMQCGESRAKFLEVLLRDECHEPDSYPLNVWLEYVAYTRVTKTPLDLANVAEFTDRVYEELVGVFDVSYSEQIDMFSSIYDGLPYWLLMQIDNKPIAFAMSWFPEGQNALNYFDDALADFGLATKLSAALENPAVVSSFRAADRVNMDLVRPEDLADPKVVELLPLILKNDESFTLFKKALRYRQLEEFAKDYYRYLRARPEGAEDTDFHAYPSFRIPPPYNK